MKSFGDVIHDDPSYATKKSQQGRIKSEIVRLLDQETEHFYDSNNNWWSVIDDLLQQIPVASNITTTQPCGGLLLEEDDPMGRLLLSAVLSHDPPVATVRHALRAFPRALERNPAAFFHACHDATSFSTDIVSLLMRHEVQVLQHANTTSPSSSKEECPYPWILSEHITLEGAQAMLQVYPRGVLQQCHMLSGYCLVDYFLLAPDMVEQRGFDITLWSKFKLILLAAEFCQDNSSNNNQDTCCRSISPVHMILRRVFSTPGFFTNLQQARHILWLMHQLCITDRWVFEAQARDGTYALHYVLSQSCTTGVVAMTGDGLLAARELVKLLLQAYPAAASIRCARHSSRLPLHLAIENGWPCHDLLLAVYPEALDIPDPQSELFPFQASAMLHPHHSTTSMPMMMANNKIGPTSSSSSMMVDICDLDVTYELLRANPAHAATMQTKGRQRVEAHA